jgi:hypothetical protein
MVVVGALRRPDAAARRPYHVHITIPPSTQTTWPVM